MASQIAARPTPKSTFLSEPVCSAWPIASADCVRRQGAGLHKGATLRLREQYRRGGDYFGQEGNYEQDNQRFAPNTGPPIIQILRHSWASKKICCSCSVEAPVGRANQTESAPIVTRKPSARFLPQDPRLRDGYSPLGRPEKVGDACDQIWTVVAAFGQPLKNRRVMLNPRSEYNERLCVSVVASFGFAAAAPQPRKGAYEGQTLASDGR